MTARESRLMEMNRTMVLEDLHDRIESSRVTKLDIYTDGGDWRCQLYALNELGYGEGSGPSVAEAIEGALDDGFRASFFFPTSHDHLDDESLRAVIDGAKEWVGGRCLSWKVVAANYLRDGRYHAAAPTTNPRGTP